MLKDKVASGFSGCLSGKNVIRIVADFASCFGGHIHDVSVRNDGFNKLVQFSELFLPRPAVASALFIRNRRCDGISRGNFDFPRLFVTL